MKMAEEEKLIIDHQQGSTVSFIITSVFQTRKIIRRWSIIFWLPYNDEAGRPEQVRRSNGWIRESEVLRRPVKPTIVTSKQRKRINSTTSKIHPQGAKVTIEELVKHQVAAKRTHVARRTPEKKKSSSSSSYCFRNECDCFVIVGINATFS